MKKIVLSFLAAFVLLSLCACGKSSSVKSEKDILADVEQNDSSFDAGLEVTSYEVEKRLTDEDSRTDTVYLTLEAENEDTDYQAEYEITYVLYNDGWLLEDFLIVSSDYSAKALPDLSVVEAELSDTYTDLELPYQNQSDTSLELKYYGIRPYGAETGGLIDACFDITVIYIYDLFSGWQISSITEDCVGYELAENIIGEWTYKNGENYIYLNVLSFDDETITFEFECDFSSSLEEDFAVDCNYSTNGAITCNYTFYTSSSDNYVSARIYQDIPVQDPWDRAIGSYDYYRLEISEGKNGENYYTNSHITTKDISYVKLCTDYIYSVGDFPELEKAG